MDEKTNGDESQCVTGIVVQESGFKESGPRKREREAGDWKSGSLAAHMGPKSG